MIRFKNKLYPGCNQGKYAPFFKPNPKSALDNASHSTDECGVKMPFIIYGKARHSWQPALLHTVAISNAKATASCIRYGL